MTITDRLLKLDPTLKRYSEGDWSGEYKESGGFSSFNDAGIECEVGEYLYSIVRLLKPEGVLETGTHFGIGASYMGMALKDNRKGKLDTIEFLKEIYDRACERLGQLKLLDYVDPHYMNVFDFKPQKEYGLILLDTEPQTRFAELIKFYPFLKDGGYVFIHDLHRHMHQITNNEHGFAWPFGKIPKEMARLVKDGKLRPFHFSSPRGLTGFYKAGKGDYQW